MMNVHDQLTKLLVACLLASLPLFALAQQGTGTTPNADAPMQEVEVAKGAFSRGDPLPGWVEPLLDIPPASSRRPVIVRLADTQFLASKENEVLVDRAIQVNENAALGNIGQYTLTFSPEYQRLRLHRLLILRGSQSIDHTSAVKVRFLQRETGLEQGVYRGQITAVLLLEDVRVGDTLHIVYSIAGDNPVFGNMYAEFASWDQNHPIEHRRVILTHPTGRNIAWKMLGDLNRKTVSPRTSIRNGMHQLHFEEKNIAAVELEPYVPTTFQQYRYIQFSEHADWNSVARWAAALFQPSIPVPEELKRVAADLARLPDEEDRIAGALIWVQTNIRYFSVAFGDSSHRPYQPDVVLQRRYGDCKDKSLLLITLLREMGIEAQAALVSTMTPQWASRMLPTPFGFNHVVVRVHSGGRDHYIDPTRLAQQGRLNRMGQALEDADVLIAAPSAVALTRIATPNAMEMARNTVEEKLTLGDWSGNAELEVRERRVGVAAESLRLALPHIEASEISKSVLSRYEQRYPGISVVGNTTLEDNPVENFIVMTSRFRIPKATIESRDEWGIRFYPTNIRGTFVVPPTMSRTAPLAIPNHPYEASYSMEMIWPSNVSVVNDPSSQRVENKYFSAEVRNSFRGNRAKVDFTLRTLAVSIPPQEVGKVFEDLRKMDKLLRGVVIVSKKEVLNQGFLGFGKQSLQDSIAARLKEGFERTSKAIQDGTLQGADLAEAHCTRAELQADMGQAAAGMKDAQDAVRLAPQAPRSYQCRANLRFANGEFAQAISDYSRALSLGGNAFELFYRRGHARFYAGQLDEAAQDFTKASQANAGEDGLYSDLWLTWTLKRLGKPLGDDLLGRAGKNPKGDWPRPALAMLAGLISLDEMMAILDRKTGEEKEMALAEGWFYTGQHYLLMKQPELARQAFQKSREKNITMYIEHVAANFELERMAKK